MAISVTNSAQTGDSSPASSIDATLTISSNSDRVLVAFAGGYDQTADPNYTSVVFDPGGSDEASFTNESGSNVTYQGGANYFRSETWYLVLDDGVSNGSYTIRFTADATWNRLVCFAWEVDGADTTDPIGASGSGSGDSDEPAASVTTTAANSWVVMGCYMAEEVSFTAGSGDTEVVERVGTGLDSGWSGYTTTTSTGTYEVSAVSSASPSNDVWTATAVELFEAAAGGDPTPSVQDDVDVSESITAAVSAGIASIQDDATIAETVTARLLSFISAQDDATIAELITAAVSDPQIDITENATVAELVTALVSSPQITITDDATLAEDVTVTVTGGVDVAAYINISPSANYVQVVTP